MTKFLYSEYAGKSINVARIIDVEYATAFPDEYAYVTYDTGGDSYAMVCVGTDELAKAGLMP